MRIGLAVCSLFFLFIDLAWPVYGQDASEANVAKSSSEKLDVDFQKIQTASRKFVESFNSANAGQIALLFTENAELVTANGTVFLGQKDIQSEYEEFFKAHPEAFLKVNVEELKFVAPNVAIETGIAASRLEADNTPERNRYSAIYAKAKDQWLLSQVREEAIAESTPAKLEELNWLIGQWVDEAPESLMQIDCYWHESGAFLIREFKIEIEGLLAASGTERIGWDPLQQRVRSWLFDSDGGFLEGNWVRHGESWSIDTRGYRPDGISTHATYTVTPLRKDAYYLSATNRTAGEEELEDFEMTVVKRPPSPGEIPELEMEKVDEETTPE